jgi:hypothetical protein
MPLEETEDRINSLQMRSAVRRDALCGGGGAFTVCVCVRACSQINGTRAASILSIIFAFFGVLGALIRFARPSTTTLLARLRIVFITVACTSRQPVCVPVTRARNATDVCEVGCAFVAAAFFAFVGMCSWAAFHNTEKGREFGAGFAVNVVAWALGAVWVFVNLMDDGPAAEHVSASKAGGTHRARRRLSFQRASCCW